LQDDVTDPICPNTDCKKTWTQTFLTDTLTAKFRLGPYKTHREKVLFDREKARLPDTQEDTKRYMDAGPVHKQVKEEMKILDTKMASVADKVTAVVNAGMERKQLYSDIYKSLPKPRTKDVICAALEAHPEYRIATQKWRALHKDYRQEWLPLKREMSALRNRLMSVQYTVVHYGHTPAAAGAGAEDADAAAAAKPTKRHFIMKCPQATCEGFLTAQYRCGLCEIHVCAHCHIPKTEDHTCDPAVVETIKQIRKEAKPCPKCASLISKVDGCDQMWCTQCHTTFSWTTGAVATGVVHNPHYFQYMRETGQAIPRADNPGFACNQVNMLARTLTRLATTVPIAEPLIETYRQLVDVREGHLMYRRQQLTAYHEEEWRRVLRVRRLVGEIDEAKWKDTLQRREKSYHKDTAWVQLIDMYTTVSLETMAELTTASTADDVERVTARLSTVKSYMQEEAAKIAKVYGCVIPKDIRPAEATGTATEAATTTA
jgi:hypothetical protein